MSTVGIQRLLKYSEHTILHFIHTDKVLTVFELESGDALRDTFQIQECKFTV